MPAIRSPASVIAVGGKHVTTDAKGHATLTLRPGSYSATATASSSAAASAKFHV